MCGVVTQRLVELTFRWCRELLTCEIFQRMLLSES